MALFSMRIQQIKRSAGRSAVAAAAYRAGERLYDARQDMTHDYSRRSGVERTELVLPDGAPAWVQGISREALWNAVEVGEKRKDAQTARELRIMIPRELPVADRITVIRDYVYRAFVAKGMIADIAWHNKVASDGLDQPHAHVMLTMRPLTDTGFGKKSRHDWVPDPEGRTHPDGRPVMVESNTDSWNSTSYYEKCREDWEKLANAALERAGSPQRIDRRSLLERGLARMPEPALRLAWYMKDLYGVMRERFGQFQVARHYREVEMRAKDGFAKIGQSPVGAADPARTAAGFFGWFDRQIERLKSPDAAPDHGRDQPNRPEPTPDMER
jgi:ATP-dependent exoDNAse (exonuclease V) alpha subunit